MPGHDAQYLLENSPLTSEGRAELTPEGYLRGWGKTVGQIGGITVEGFAPGAIWHHTDGSDEATYRYLNTGTKTTATWTAIDYNITENAYLSGVTAGTAADSKALVLDADGSVVHGGDLRIGSTDPMTLALNAVDALQLDNAAISGFAAETDTAGNGVYIETEDAGATPTAARAGGLLNLKTGDGASAANAVACGAGGALSIISGAGGANTGGATGQVGGAGGAFALTAGAGGDTDSTGAHAAGAGGAITITAGAGGAASAGSGDGGAGGKINLVPGAGGASSGGTAGAEGLVNITGGISVLQLGTTVQPGSTVGTDYLSMKSTGTAPTGTGANAGHLYADFETDDDELFFLTGTGGTANQLTT